METALFVFSIILQAFVLSLGTYYFIVSLFGWMPKANDKLPEELHYHKNIVFPPMMVVSLLILTSK